MAASHIQSTADETDKATCQDTFPEVAYFEVPSELSNKTVSSKTRDLVKHPAFREISAINGEINRMAVKGLKVELDALGLDSRGTKDVLRKRLKAYERRRVLTAAGIEDPNTPRQHYTHLLVIDFEATCEEHQTKDYVHEIIEFPAVLVRVDDVAVVAEFHSLVRPLLNPNLSPFCIQLTGIPQESVDSAPPFPEVLNQFEQWLTEQGVTNDGRSKLAVATDGPWDMARFLLMQCNVSKLPFPTWARSWINLRKIFSNFYVTKRLCLSEMLSTLGLEFRGRPHCGLDDARNIAAIAEVLVRDGAAPRVNETIAHLPRSAPPSLKGSSVSSVTLKEFETSERRRLRASGRNTRLAAVTCTNDGGDASINTDTNTEAYAVDANSVGGGTCNTIDSVCGAVGQLEQLVDSLSLCNSNVEKQMNGNYEDVEGGNEAVVCNGYSKSSSIAAVVQPSAGYINGYVKATVPDGEDHHRYQDDESCGTLLPSSYDGNCDSISNSRRADSPTHHSTPSSSSNILNSSYASPHHSNRIMYVQGKTQNAGGNDAWSHLNGLAETTPVDLQDSSTIGDVQNPVSNSESLYPKTPGVPSPSSDRSQTFPPVCRSADIAGGEASNHQEKLEYYNSMPYINIEYPSSGVRSTTSSASPRSVSRQSSYAEHNSDHHSTSKHPQDNGSHTHQALAEPPLNKNASGLRRLNNRRHNNNNNQANTACKTNSSGTETRPPQHQPVNKGSVRYPYRNIDDSATNSSSRGKQNKKAGGKPSNPRMGGGSAASFFSHASTPPASPATISMDLSDANEFPVLGSMKRCPR